MQQDWQALLDWLGIESRDQMTREHHEKFARGFETYLMEGKAPSVGLRRAFAAFSAWLKNIYRRMRGLGVELTPEVRAVMDRMLATDEQIEQAQAEAGMAALFDESSAKDVIPPAERPRYKQALDDARQEAEDQVRAEVMAVETRAHKAWWKQEYQSTLESVTTELAQNPEYVALAHLQHGKTPEGSDLPDGITAMKLDKAELVQRYGPQVLENLPGPKHPRSPGRHVYAVEGGVSVDFAAEMLGFNTGDDLVVADWLRSGVGYTTRVIRSKYIRVADWLRSGVGYTLRDWSNAWAQLRIGYGVGSVTLGPV